MRLVYIAALIFAGCASRAPIVPHQTDEIGIRFTGLTLEFGRNVNGKWNSIVQEIRFDNGDVLVEAFSNQTMAGYVWDKHQWSSGGTGRSMKVYLAIVQGVDWSPNGFAHLPSNMDGSAVTTVGPSFNEDYQAHHRTTGRVVAQSDEWLTWRVDASDHRVVAEAPGK